MINCVRIIAIFCRILPFENDVCLQSTACRANSVASGELSVLADMINNSLKHVSGDLQPLCEDDSVTKFLKSASSRRKRFWLSWTESVFMRRHPVRMICLTGCCMILLHFYANHCVKSSTPVFAKAKCRLCGNTLMYRQFQK